MANDLYIMGIKGSGFLNLKLIDVTFENGVNVVSGKNRQGKSNLLKLIQMLKGKAFMPELPKNKDEKKGKFELYLGDPDRELKYTVKYSFTDKNSYMSVEDANGQQVGIEVLKSFLSPCLDPWEFFENATATGLGAKERRSRAIEVLKGLMSFNWDAGKYINGMGLSENAHVKSLMSQNDKDPLGLLKAMEEFFSQNRKEWKDEAKRLEGATETLEKEIPLEKRKLQEVDVKDLFAEHEKLQQSVTKNQVALEKAKSLEEEIERLNHELDIANSELEALREENTELESTEQIEEQMVELKTRMDNINADNAIARKVTELAEKEALLDVTKGKIESRTEDLENIREERLRVLEAADMPVDGLSVDEGNILKNGLPFGQDSTEEGITDSFLIGLARFKKMAPDMPKLMTMVINNASLMDSEAKERLYALAKEHGVQLILEIVMDEKKSGVIFVDDGVAVNKE